MTSRQKQLPNTPVDPVRSEIMRAVRRAHTSPEISVRKILHSLGLRFRLHRKDLPGTPDIVLRKHKTAIFVNGCFWHRHKNCWKATTPKTRTEFWISKFAANIARDRRSERSLVKAGWSVLKVWECETLNPDKLRTRLIRRFMVSR
jgi:DNA mismatch endonuclease (patch repair protein)